MVQAGLQLASLLPQVGGAVSLSLYTQLTYLPLVKLWDAHFYDTRPAWHFWDSWMTITLSAELLSSTASERREVTRSCLWWHCQLPSVSETCSPYLSLLLVSAPVFCFPFRGFTLVNCESLWPHSTLLWLSLAGLSSLVVAMTMDKNNGLTAFQEYLSNIINPCLWYLYLMYLCHSLLLNFYSNRLRKSPTFTLSFITTKWSTFLCNEKNIFLLLFFLFGCFEFKKGETIIKWYLNLNILSFRVNFLIVWLQEKHFNK